MTAGRKWGEYYRVAHRKGLIPNEIRNPCRTLVACLGCTGNVWPGKISGGRFATLGN